MKLRENHHQRKNQISVVKKCYFLKKSSIYEKFLPNNLEFYIEFEDLIRRLR